MLKNALKLLHPFMPFVTEEIYSKLIPQEESLMMSDWPQYKKEWEFPHAENVVEHLKLLASGVRNIREGLILFLKTGVCGGFTTFSTFSLEAWQLLEKGETGLSTLYVLLSVLSCLAGVAAADRCKGEEKFLLFLAEESCILPAPSL